MDWKDIFRFAGDIVPLVGNFLQAAQGPIGLGMMGAGFGNALKGQQQAYDAWKRKYDDEWRLM